MAALVGLVDHGKAAALPYLGGQCADAPVHRWKETFLGLQPFDAVSIVSP
jgi:hypothetical protein